MSINRQQVVKRNNPINKDFSYPLSVGNGNIAFTTDITGLQTFMQRYEKDFPLCTMAHWAVNSKQPGKFNSKDFRLKYYDFNGRKVGYAQSKDGQNECYDWLRENPHKFSMARIYFIFDGQEISDDDIHKLTDIRQELDLYTGIINSSFKLDGEIVNVKTCCHQEYDAIGFNVSSKLLEEHRLQIAVCFPYSSHLTKSADFNNDSAHTSRAYQSDNGLSKIVRVLDDFTYFVTATHPGASLRQTASHSFVFDSKGTDKIELTFHYGREPFKHTLLYSDAEKSSVAGFEKYWGSGGFVDFGMCNDSRAKELERRVILSQYLTYIQCSGSYPPPETGLTMNSWYGRFHLEMHYWHSYHFILFQKPWLMENSMWWYEAILPKAKSLAECQGFKGARWPKMPDNKGNDSPSPIAPLLIWQQPHPINYASAVYRHYKSNGLENQAVQTLERYRDIVFQTADFMVSYAYYDKNKGKYVLGPAMIPAQENHSPLTAVNPVFELEYWKFGLKTSIEWARALGVEPPTEWIDVCENLSPLPVIDGLYPAHENCTDTYTKFNFDHPSFLCAYGMLPGEMVDRNIMKASLEKTLVNWKMDQLWGWDFPVLAMTATRLGMPDRAVEFLLMDSPKNTYLSNGHNMQVPRSDLPLYLPGNGGLLTAVALMCAGFDGCGNDYKGFPDGWDVRFENINPLI